MHSSSLSLARQMCSALMKLCVYVCVCVCVGECVCMWRVCECVQVEGLCIESLTLVFIEFYVRVDLKILRKCICLI